MSDHRRDGGTARLSPPVRMPVVGRWATLSAVLLAGVAGCTSSPEYPIARGERAGDGTITANPPRYPMSRADAAQNARDRARYPDYGAQPVQAPPAPAADAASAAQSAPSADPDDDAAPAHPLSQGSVDSADLPPPPAGATPDSDAGQAPHAISWGGGQIVFGAEPVSGPVLELAAYRHRRHRAEAAADPAKDDTAPADAAPAHKGRRHGAKASETTAQDSSPAPSSAAADTPYQTVVRPGEKLADVAERIHSSKDALVQLNDLKHPRHVKAGTVLKIPYRYAYEVQKGDTLYTISHRFNQDPDAIAKLNGLKTAPTLQPGQSLTLPTDVADNGKRDHAAAAAPVPVAAPDKLADAALKKAERRDRRHRHGAEPVQTASAEPAPAVAPTPDETPPAHETRRERRARERREAAEARLASRSTVRTPPARPAPAPTAASEVAADAAPLRPSPEPVPPATVPAMSPAPLRPSPEPVQPATALATAPDAPRPPSFVPPNPAAPLPRATVTAATGAPSTTASATSGASVNALAATAPTPSPYYAGVRSTPAPAAAPPYYAGVRPSPAPGYPAQASSGARIASLTPPRYTPGSPSGAYEPSLGRVRPTAPTGPAGPVSASDVATAGRGRFVWPLRGQVVSAFGARGEGRQNDGLDIAAAPGTGVRAAAAGEVVYAGSSIPGFGNLILVKHPGGWVTAYAHLDRIEVRMRDTVAQGQEIGQSGQTGAVDRPLLHFEVRYAADPTEKARPVDPALVLPTG